MFIAYITAKGELPIYIGFLIGNSSANNAGNVVSGGGLLSGVSSLFSNANKVSNTGPQSGATDILGGSASGAGYGGGGG